MITFRRHFKVYQTEILILLLQNHCITWIFNCFFGQIIWSRQFLICPGWSFNEAQHEENPGFFSLTLLSRWNFFSFANIFFLLFLVVSRLNLERFMRLSLFSTEGWMIYYRQGNGERGWLVDGLVCACNSWLLSVRDRWFYRREAENFISFWGQS